MHTDSFNQPNAPFCVTKDGIALATYSLPEFQCPTSGMPTPFSDHIPLGGVFRLERGLLSLLGPCRSPTSPEEQAAGCGRRWIAPAAPSRCRIRQAPAHHNRPHSNFTGSSSLNRVGRYRGSTEAVGGGSSLFTPFGGPTYSASISLALATTRADPC
jgi:hypothetical protein